MSTIKSFFDKYLPFSDRKRKLSDDLPQQNDYGPRRKLPKLAQLAVVRRKPEVLTVHNQQQPQHHHQVFQRPISKPPKAAISSAFPFRNKFSASVFPKSHSRYATMETVDLDSDDEVELVEFLQTQEMSPATFRTLSGQNNACRPLPELIPRYQANKLNGTGTATFSSNHQNINNNNKKSDNNFGNTSQPNSYLLFRRRLDLESRQSRGQKMLNSALQRNFRQEEKQKYSQIYDGLQMRGGLFGGMQNHHSKAPVDPSQSSSSSSIFASCIPFSSKHATNIGSRNKYSELLEKFSNKIDPRQNTFRANVDRRPAVCVDLTKEPDRQRRCRNEVSVELTDDEEDEEEDGATGRNAVLHITDGGSSFKIPKSFPCAASLDSPFLWQQDVVTAQKPLGVTSPNRSRTASSFGLFPEDATITLDDDDDRASSSLASRTGTTSERRRRTEKVEPVNSLLEEWQPKPVFQTDWLEATRRRYSESQDRRATQIAEEEQHQAEMDREGRRDVQEMIRKMDEALLLREVIVVEDEEEKQAQLAKEQQEKADTPLPVFSAEQVNKIRYAEGRGSPDEVLITKFNLNITRRDIATLMGDAWLNDEVINFYMNLLMERSSSSGGGGGGGKSYPKVYAMNTFFMPKVLQQGQSGVRRWTRKTDIFAYDVIPVPVHVSNIHWCMAIIHLRDKTIRYYDSMGQPNNRVLGALEQYLKDESMDKRQVAFSTEGWVKENVADCPRQMNGSDCGVFSCMFAEYVTRDHRINFSQDNMPYFRKKMVLEICTGKLLL